MFYALAVDFRRGCCYVSVWSSAEGRTRAVRSFSHFRRWSRMGHAQAESRGGRRRFGAGKRLQSGFAIAAALTTGYGNRAAYGTRANSFEAWLSDAPSVARAGFHRFEALFRPWLTDLHSRGVIPREDRRADFSAAVLPDLRSLLRRLNAEAAYEGGATRELVRHLRQSDPVVLEALRDSDWQLWRGLRRLMTFSPLFHAPDRAPILPGAGATKDLQPGRSAATNYGGNRRFALLEALANYGIERGHATAEDAYIRYKNDDEFATAVLASYGMTRHATSVIWDLTRHDLDQVVPRAPYALRDVSVCDAMVLLMRRHHYVMVEAPFGDTRVLQLERYLGAGGHASLWSVGGGPFALKLPQLTRRRRSGDRSGTQIMLEYLRRLPTDESLAVQIHEAGLDGRYVLRALVPEPTFSAAQWLRSLGLTPDAHTESELRLRLAKPPSCDPATVDMYRALVQTKRSWALGVDLADEQLMWHPFSERWVFVDW